MQLKIELREKLKDTKEKGTVFTHLWLWKANDCIPPDRRKIRGKDVQFGHSWRSNCVHNSKGKINVPVLKIVIFWKEKQSEPCCFFLAEHRNSSLSLLRGKLM